MGRRNVLGCGKEIDYDALLAELKSEKKNENREAKVQSVVDVEVQKEKQSEFRHRVSSDESIKYFFSADDNLIHDKSCVIAKGIPDDKLGVSSSYMPDKAPCSECSHKAYIRAGAEDIGNYNEYRALFRKMRVNGELLHFMYIESGMKTKLFGNTLTVWKDEDKWKIVLNDNGTVKLMHNNYQRTRNGRIFTEGYHIQNDTCNSASFKHALNIINGYTFQWHIESDKIEQNKPVLESCWQKLKKKLLHWITQIRYKLKKRNYTITVKDFNIVSEVGFPKKSFVCMYIWLTANNEPRWQIGLYCPDKGVFTVNYGDFFRTIKQKKVIAWKKLTEEEMIL